MTTALEEAFPLNSNWPAANVRSKLAEAMIAVFDTPDLSGEDFSIQPHAAIAVAGPGGDLTFYAYDAADTTTADDGGITCIVVSGRRYIRSGEVIVRDAAISATVTAQPSVPTFGDTYIVPQAPTGDDWAGHARSVATYTARGWIFRQPFIGMIVYVEDEDGLYHYDSAGSWISGLPIGAIQDGSIPPNKLSDPFAILRVVDERNAPPGGSPATGTMYQVGTGPTGPFAGHDRQIARWNGAGYIFIIPTEGATIYRSDMETLYSYKSGLWEPTVRRPAIERSFYREVDSASNNGTGIVDHVTIPALVLRPGQQLRFSGMANGTPSGGGIWAIGLRIDGRAAVEVALMEGQSIGYVSHQIDPPDSGAHDYHLSSERVSGSDSLSNISAFFFLEIINPD